TPWSTTASPPASTPHAPDRTAAGSSGRSSTGHAAQASPSATYASSRHSPNTTTTRHPKRRNTSRRTHRTLVKPHAPQEANMQRDGPRLEGRDGAIWRAYLLGNTQEAIATTHGLSQSRVSQILDKIRATI